MADTPNDFVKKLWIQMEAAGADQTSEAIKKVTKTIGGLQKSTNSLLGPVSKIAAMFGAGLGLKEAIGKTQEYYKSLIKVSSQMSKYGIGAQKVEKLMGSMTKTLHVTRMEATELFAQFEKGFPLVTIKGFEKVMKNIKNVVGSNIAAMKEMAGSLSGLAMQYPWLQESMENLTKLDQERLDRNLELLMVSGKLNLTQIKGLRDYVRQNKQVSKGDDKRVSQWQKFQDSVKDLKVSFEKIVIVLGEAFIPLIKDLSKWMEKNKKWIVDITKFIGTWAARLVPVVIAFKAISGVGTGMKVAGAGLGGMMGGDANCEKAKKCADKAAKTFWGEGKKGKILGAAKVFGIAMAGVAGGMIGREVGKHVAQSLGAKKGGAASQYISHAGATLGGASAGGMAAGLPGAAIGAVAGFGYSIAKDIISVMSRPGENELVEMNKRKLAASKLKSTEEAYAAGELTERQYKARTASSGGGHTTSNYMRIKREKEKEKKGLEQSNKTIRGIWGTGGEVKANEKRIKTLKGSIKYVDELIKKRLRVDNLAKEESKAADKQAADEKKRQEDLYKTTKRLDEQRELRSAMVSQLGKQVDLMLLSNKLDSSSVKNNVELTKQQIEQEKILARKLIGIAEERLRTAEREKDLDTIRKETTYIKEQETKITEAKITQLSLWKQTIKMYETEKELAGSTAQIMETHVGLLDQMGMGIGAPAQMRYKLMEQIGKKVTVVDKQIADAREAQAKGEGNQADILKTIKKLEIERLQLIQKQFQVSKALREGWTTALGAMTVASGRVTKIMISRQTNLATMLKRGGVISNVSGRLGGGATGASRFAIGMGGGLGITGGGNAGYQTEYGPDINVVRQMQEGIMRGNLGASANAAIRQGQIMQQRATSGTSGAAYLSGPQMAAYSVPGAGGIRKAGASVSPAGGIGGGGGWQNRGGVAVLNLHIEVHSKAELIKTLVDWANKLD